MRSFFLMLIGSLFLSYTALAQQTAHRSAPGSEAARPLATDERLNALGSRLQRLQDANEIEILQRTYGYFVDKAMWTEIADLFTENGTYEIGGRGVFVGKQRVLEYLRVGWARSGRLRGGSSTTCNFSRSPP